MQKLDKAFYEREDVVKIAKQLIGKVLVTTFDGVVTCGRIVETEAYNGAVDKASHAYNNRRTKRTEIMFGEGGNAYVYLCYGIHHLFNVVTNVKDVPHAVLIRAIEPLEGIDTMLERMKKTKLDFSIGRGPGNVSKALGIATHHSGNTLFGKDIYIADDGFKVSSKNIIASKRIGVDYAAEDALLPYRFYLKENGYVSGKK
ncbi:DNA-3-methyladenine glycosylase [Pinibacter soli]|uniref:Putative 3-methyladenine DNA glycosylase n=1 Tax=Pinibacter soli TaxID=3044211 RepID=A0ABT6RCB5_9BACT|nr:DNA-3-methyladenine glycosylase [Pinibacter soli]MDI3320208.1 DNA-3-methyladenine glycosylase [Pinibacter soli]